MAVNPGNTGFVLVSAALVLLMTPGLAFFYGGLVRRKNVLTIMMQSFIAIGVVTIIWVLFGFSLAFGTDNWGLIGGGDYLGLVNVSANSVSSVLAARDLYGANNGVPLLAYFVFQLMFAIITPALVTGAFADRVTFKAYLLFLILWSILVYIPFTHWVWGGGFLAQWGVADFAGGLVVHASAGFAALASVFVIRKRVLKSDDNLAPHNIPFVALGAGLLWFGWFGFNGGSAVGATGQALSAFVNTQLAASTAMVTWLIIGWIHNGKPSFVGALTGAVAGLATVTPASGFVPPWAAAVIGVAASIVCYAACQIRFKRAWDDALDVWGVHGVGGALGIILTGVFADSAIGVTKGLIDNDATQLGVQALAALIVVAYSFIVTLIIFKLVSFVTPLQVPAEVELIGLDEHLHGELAYDYPLAVEFASATSEIGAAAPSTPSVQQQDEDVTTWQFAVLTTTHKRKTARKP